MPMPGECANASQNPSIRRTKLQWSVCIKYDEWNQSKRNDSIDNDENILNAISVILLALNRYQFAASNNQMDGFHKIDFTLLCLCSETDRPIQYSECCRFSRCSTRFLPLHCGCSVFTFHFNLHFEKPGPVLRHKFYAALRVWMVNRVCHCLLVSLSIITFSLKVFAFAFDVICSCVTSTWLHD